jgi:hypothetical protein
MTVSPSIPATVEMRRSRLLGLVAVVAVAAAAVTWATFAATESSGTNARSATPPALVAQAGQYGRGLSRIGSYFRSTGNSDLQLTPAEKRYVHGIASLSRVEQAAAFGAHGGVVDALGLSPREAAYVKAIVSLTPAQMTGAFGTDR